MKHEIERRKAKGLADHAALALTTWGVGYLPAAPGTFGSAVGVAIYLAVSIVNAQWRLEWAGQLGLNSAAADAFSAAAVSVLLVILCLAGIYAAGRSCELFGNTDPSHAVVDEVIGQLITFVFVPFTIGWPFVLAGFLLFRLFDIWKPYPIDDLQGLPAGIGICADDILAGVYAGIVLAIAWAIHLAV